MQLNICFTLTRNSRKYKDKIAVIFREKRITYEELNTGINGLANAVISHGVKKGMKVALIFNNSIEFVESIYATLS